MIHPTQTDCRRAFKVVAVSTNTNSFGLYQMLVIAKDGTSYKTHASYLNVKKQGEILTQHYNLNEKGVETNHRFLGCELTELIEPAPEDVIAAIWPPDDIEL